MMADTEFRTICTTTAAKPVPSASAQSEEYARNGWDHAASTSLHHAAYKNQTRDSQNRKAAGARNIAAIPNCSLAVNGRTE